MEITEEEYTKLKAERDHYKIIMEELRKEIFYGKIDLEVNQSHLKRLIDLSRNLTSNLDINKIGEILLENIEQILNYDVGYFYVLNDGILTLSVMRNVLELGIDNLSDIEVKGNDFFNRIVSEKKALLVDNLNEEDANGKMGIPIIFNQEVIGIVLLESKLSGVFSKEEIFIAENIVDTAAIALENAKLFENFKEKTNQLMKTLGKLKTTQAQLISNEKMIAVGRLAGGLAHEINSPLAGMLTTIQLMKFDIEDMLQCEEREELSENIGTIESGIKKIKAIIQNFLGYTSREEEYQSINLRDVIIDSISTIKKDLEKNEINLLISIDDNILIMGSRLEIVNMITNILINAKDAVIMKESLEKSIKVKSLKRGKTIAVEVEDNGVGIIKENMSKVFEPFFTTKGVGGGKGLGLTVSYDIAKKYYGNIKIESSAGEGTKVTIEIEQ